MKTPDEIKKGLVEAIEEASWVVEGGDAHDLQDACDMAHASMADALSYIQRLETDTCNWEIEATLLKRKLAEAERERDAAVRDCARFPCYTCDERENGDMCHVCMTKGTLRTEHVWRGVCDENNSKSQEEN